MGYNHPEWIKWEDDVIVQNTIKKVLKKYQSIDDYFRFVSDKSYVLNMEYEEVRDAITFLVAYGYQESGINDDRYFDRYDDKKKAEENFNEWFNSHISANMLDLYNFYDSIYNKEKWTGERRFALLIRTVNKGYSEMSCLKAAVRFQWLQNVKPNLLTNLGSAKMLYKYLQVPYWGFGEEKNRYEYDIEKSKEDFAICNNMRKREIQKQDAFIYAIFVDKNIEKAYGVMPDCDKIKE